MDTLLLNADASPVSYFPVSLLTWEEAVKMVLTDKAVVLEEYSNWDVHSPSLTMAVPAVVMLTEFSTEGRSVPFSRAAILLRDHFTCQYCGINCRNNHRQLTLDHVIPKMRGGRKTWDNMVTACHSCNGEKSHYMNMKPRTRPKKPSYHHMVELKREMCRLTAKHESWNEYLQFDPKNVRMVSPNDIFEACDAT